jgi:hypothetical protein
MALAGMAAPVVEAQVNSTPPQTAPAQAVPLSRFVPRENLLALALLDGIDTHAEAWNQTAASKILNETTLGPLFEDLIGQLADQSLRNMPNRKLTRDDAVAIVKHGLKSGALVSVHRPAAGQSQAVTTIVCRDAFREDVRPLFARLIGTLMPSDAKPKLAAKPGSRQVVSFPFGNGDGDGDGGEATWWIEKNRDLVIVFGPSGVDPLIAALDGQAPDASTHPAIQDGGPSRGGFESLLTAFVDLAERPPPPNATGTGIENLKRIDFRLGLQRDAMVSVLGIVAPAPRSGLLSLIDQPSFSRENLPPLPAGLDGFTVLSVDLPRTLETLEKLDPTALPGGGVAPAAPLPDTTLLKGLRELAGPLGTTLAFYQPSDARPQPVDSTNPLAALNALLKIKAVLVAPLKDGAAFNRALDKQIVMINTQIKEALTAIQPPPAQGGEVGGPAGGQGQPRPQLVPPEFKRVGLGQTRTYLMNLPTAWVALGATIKPTIKTSPTHVVLATAPDLAQQTLDLQADEAAPRWTPTGSLQQAWDDLPSQLLLLSVSDPRTSLAETLQGLPAALQGGWAATQGMAPAPAAPGMAMAMPPIRVDPSQIPRAEDLQDKLFPGVTVATVDERGLTVSTREAFLIQTTQQAAIVAALAMPAIQQAREAARKAQADR